MSTQARKAPGAWLQAGPLALVFLLFFLVPLAGWAYSSAAGFPIVWFGVLPLPDFVPVDKALVAALSQQAGYKVSAVHNPREQRRVWLEMSEKNADISAEYVGFG